MALLRLPALILILAKLSQIITVLPVIKADDGAALLDFINSADPAHAFIKWGNGQDNINHYCNWTGVLKCDENNTRVVALVLENIGLNGTIIPDFFSRLGKLRILNLRQNKLGGTIPDLSGGQNLHTLLLDGNDLIGTIPKSLGQLPSLKIVNLSNNYLSGNLPDSPYFYIESLIFDVSNNHLSGAIPPSLSQKNASSLEGNPDLCGQPLITACPQVSREGHKGLDKAFVIYMVVGIVVGTTLILGGSLCIGRKQGREKLLKRSPSSDQSGRKLAKLYSNDKGMESKEMNLVVHPKNDDFLLTREVQGEGLYEKRELVFIDEGERMFELKDLLKASALILGRSISGTSYKATLEGGLEVVVKRLSTINQCGRDEFMENMAAIGRSRHPNIFPLRAHLYGKEEKLFIYEYVPHGSLFNALHSLEGRRNTPLDWISRIKIARGVASALHYIHTSLSSPSKPGECRFHGNLKSSNILLGPNKEALVADFGVASMLANTAAQSYMAGHRAPECRKGSKELTQSVDMYSYGVLLLELLTGKMPLQSTTIAAGAGQGVDLPTWVESVVREEWTAEVFDHDLSFSKAEEDELVVLLRIAMACVSPKLEQRPTMAHILQSISQDIKSLEEDDEEEVEASYVDEDHGALSDDDARSSLQLDPHHSDMEMPSYEFSFSFEGHFSRIHR